MKDTCYVLLHRPTQFRLHVVPNRDPGRRTIQWIDHAISCWFTFPLCCRTDVYLQNNPPPGSLFLLKVAFCFDGPQRVSIFPLIILICTNQNLANPLFRTDCPTLYTCSKRPDSYPPPPNSTVPSYLLQSYARSMGDPGPSSSRKPSHRVSQLRSHVFILGIPSLWSPRGHASNLINPVFPSSVPALSGNIAALPAALPLTNAAITSSIKYGLALCIPATSPDM